jgi:hypothetical protein
VTYLKINIGLGRNVLRGWQSKILKLGPCRPLRRHCSV